MVIVASAHKDAENSHARRNPAMNTELLAAAELLDRAYYDLSSAPIDVRQKQFATTVAARVLRFCADPSGEASRKACDHWHREHAHLIDPSTARRVWQAALEAAAKGGEA